MLTMKESKTIKNILKKHDMYNKGMLCSVTKIYDAVKHVNDEVLYITMHEKNNPMFYMDVKTALAYRELKETSDKYSKYEREVLTKKTIAVDGKAEECIVVDFNESPFNVHCEMLIDIINVYDELKNGFKTNGSLVNTVLIILINMMILRYEKMKMNDGISSIEERVKKIKAAEDAYGVKFFVNDYLYDTFMHPELFESYGIYKMDKIFSMSKENIIQDTL